MTPASENAVVTKTSGRVRLIGLNRPAVINAVNDAIRSGLRTAVLEAEADDDVLAILFHGYGKRGFCAGADIKETRAPETPIETRLRLDAGGWIETLAAARKPTVAAIHGICLGAGAEIALACDLRIAAPDAIFGLPETGIGLIPGAGGTQRLPRLVGEGLAMHLILTGEHVSAERASHIGLVSVVSATVDSLLDEALALATRIAERPPTATRFAKEAVRAAGNLPLADGLVVERTLFALLNDTEDRREAARAFSQKRAPRYVGR